MVVDCSVSVYGIGDVVDVDSLWYVDYDVRSETIQPSICDVGISEIHWAIVVYSVELSVNLSDSIADWNEELIQTDHSSVAHVAVIAEPVDWAILVHLIEKVVNGGVVVGVYVEVVQQSVNAAIGDEDSIEVNRSVCKDVILLVLV